MPKKESDPSTPPPTNPQFTGPDISFYEMTTDVHTKLGKLEEAVSTLKTQMEKSSSDLDVPKVLTTIQQGVRLARTILDEAMKR